MVREFEARRDFVVGRLKAMPGLSCYNPQGAFYVFPNVRSLFGRKWKDKTLATPADVVEYFLEEARVLCVPGEDFGSTENIRLSYATSLAELEKGCDRIEAAIKKLI
jgi:aspartate aminotransferase